MGVKHQKKSINNSNFIIFPNQNPMFSPQSSVSFVLTILEPLYSTTKSLEKGTHTRTRTEVLGDITLGKVHFLSLKQT